MSKDRCNEPKVICIGYSSKSKKDYPSSKDYGGGGNSGSKSSESKSNDYAQKSSVNGRYSGYTDLTVFEQDLDYPENNKGVFNLSHVHKGAPWVVKQLSHLNDVRSTMPHGWGQNVFKNIQVLDLSHNGLLGIELSPLCKSLYYQQINFKVLNLSNNKLDNASLGEILWSIGNDNVKNKFQHTVETLILCNNQIDDLGAEYLSWHIPSESLKSTRYIDLSGNNITEKGDTKLVQALKNRVQDIIILTQRLEKNSKLLPGIGTKEDKIAAYKEFIKKGIEKGANDQAIVVDQSFVGQLENIKNQFVTSGHGTFGFIKCNWQLEELVKSYAQDTITAKISKTFSKVLSKVTDIEGIVSCYLEATDEMWNCEAGQKALQHELCVMGESEFCGDQ